MKSVWVAALLCAWSAVAGAATEPRVVRITAKKFEFSPSKVELKRGEPVILELTSLDRKHGLKLPELNIDAVIPAKGSVRVRVLPERAGTFSFHCSVFCGGGHEDMTGQLVVNP